MYNYHVPSKKKENYSFICVQRTEVETTFGFGEFGT